MIWSALAGLAGKLVGGVFGLKKKQADVIEKGIGTISTVAKADNDRAKAVADAIESAYKHGNWLERSIRPVYFGLCIAFQMSRYLGYEAPNLTPEDIQHINDVTMISLVGYQPIRSLDKWMKGFALGGILKKMAEKKLL